MKNNIKKIILLALIIFSTIPHLSLAVDPVTKPGLNYNNSLVQCDGVLAIDGSEPDRNKVCDFAALIDTIKNLVNMAFLITVPIAITAFAYAGLLYMTGSQGNIGTAKKIFQSVATGFIIMLVAWFAVVTVVGWFAKKDSGVNIFVDVPTK